MYLKAIYDENFNHYRVCSMVLAFPYCDWKCGKELCHNSPLACAPLKDFKIEDIIERYRNNKLSRAIVCAGLEPFDSFLELKRLVAAFRAAAVDDPIVIYTGYNKTEVKNRVAQLAPFGNIIIKFGRFIPNQVEHRDPVLGVDLQSDNQYAEVIG